jgi:hypothetical protein
MTLKSGRARTRRISGGGCIKAYLPKKEQTKLSRSFRDIVRKSCGVSLLELWSWYKNTGRVPTWNGQRLQGSLATLQLAGRPYYRGSQGHQEKLTKLAKFATISSNWGSFEAVRVDITTCDGIIANESMCVSGDLFLATKVLITIQSLFIRKLCKYLAALLPTGWEKCIYFSQGNSL